MSHRRRVLAALAGATQVTGSLLTPLTRATRGMRRSMGASPRALREVRYSSSHYREGVFENILPMGIVEVADGAPIVLDWIRRGDSGRPSGEVPLATTALPEQAAALAATWLGHATVLLEIDGHWVLTDPVWSERVSPSAAVGPRRNHPVPLKLNALPRLTAVVISHDHYDHLDTATIDALVTEQRMPFVVPLGIGEHLRGWGVPDDRIIELDWDQSCTVEGVELTCAEARHFSGRGLTRNTTLWAAWVLAGPEHRVFFGGDTGATPAFADIGTQYGPFDLTVLPIGAYDRRWPDVHLNPAEAVQTHTALRGGVLLPIHWATFDLAFHAWADPIRWLVREADEQGVQLAAPRPGARFEVPGELPREPWWDQAAR